MRQRNRFGFPALVLSIIALFAALGGTVYAAKTVKKIDGKLIKVKSIPGNRIKPRSITAKQLSLGVLLTAGSQQITGAQIKESTLGEVPNAAHATTADTARSATDALTALAAVNAITAEKINGYSAGCLPGTLPFAGACWQSSPNSPATNAVDAAIACALKNGTLPSALELSAFAQLAGLTLDAEGEWASDIVTFTTVDVFSAAIVLPSGSIDDALFNKSGVSETKKYRCVIPLVK